MKNYRLNIYFTDKLSLHDGLDRVYVNSVFFQNVTVRFIKCGDDGYPFDVIKFFRNKKLVAMFFPNDVMTYEVLEEE